MLAHWYPPLGIHAAAVPVAHWSPPLGIHATAVAQQPRMQVSPGQGVRPASTRRGPGQYVRGDLRERPFTSSILLAVSGAAGAVVGGVCSCSLEGVLLGSGLLWLTASFADVLRSSPALARCISAAQERRRARWVARAEAAENALQKRLKESPVCAIELRHALKAAMACGVEHRGPQLTKRAAALLELVERPSARDDSSSVADDGSEDATVPLANALPIVLAYGNAEEDAGAVRMRNSVDADDSEGEAAHPRVSGSST